MMNEERHKIIMRELIKNGTVHVLDLVELLHASESTIRRDLLELDRQGLLKRIHGGAIVIDKKNEIIENPLSERQLQQLEEKDAIGNYASTLLDDNELVYIDAGSSTLKFVEHITQKNATYVTNGLLHAQLLSQNGCKVICLGGEIRGVTGACVGTRTLLELSRYHFTKGFFGTNGIDIEHGFTTPDMEEATIKEYAFKQCQNCYVLCDHTKFNKVSPVHFGDIKDAIIITDFCNEEVISKHATIKEVLAK